MPASARLQEAEAQGGDTVQEIQGSPITAPRSTIALAAALMLVAIPATIAGPGAADTPTPAYLQAAKLTPETPAINDHAGLAVDVHEDTLAVGVPGDDVAADGGGSVHVYTHTEDGWTLDTVLTPTGLETGTRFGLSLDLGPETLVVGAPGSDHAGIGAGEVHVYTHTRDGEWVHTARVTPDEPDGLDSFGVSVAYDAHRLVAGAPGRDTGAFNGGAAFVFEHAKRGGWHQVAELVPEEVGFVGAAGASVDVSGTDVIVGAPSVDSDTVINAGEAYLFAPEDGVWAQQATLSETGMLFEVRSFGHSVAIEDGQALVGAPGPGYEQIPDPPLDERPPGRVYAYDQGDDGTWSREAQLVPVGALTMDRFGVSVDLDGDRAAIGASETILDSEVGAAYVFHEAADGAWIQTSRNVHQDPDLGDRLGRSVAVSGSTLVAGAPGVDTGADDAGAAYVFTGATSLSSTPGAPI